MGTDTHNQKDSRYNELPSLIRKGLIALEEKINLLTNGGGGMADELAEVKASIVTVNESLAAMAQQLQQKAGSEHEHTIGNITNLTERLAALAQSIEQLPQSDHEHPMSKITGLTEALAAINEAMTQLPQADHEHPVSKITGLVEKLAAIDDAIANHTHDNLVDGW